MPSSVTPQYLPFEQIVADAEALRPERAIERWGDEGYMDACVSSLYERVLLNGREVSLSLHNGKWAAIYVRVSTFSQRGEARDDGYSVRFQIENNVRWCIDQGYAFRIFSDAGLSGTLPTRDEELIQEMRDTNADLYQEAFEAALLSPTATAKLSPDEKKRCENYLQVALGALRTGGKGGTVFGEHQEISNDRNWPVVDNVFRAFIIRRKHQYRPALHILFTLFAEIHGIVVTDYDRLSRSLLLSEVLRRKLLRQKVMVYGTTENLNWATDTDEKGTLMNALMPLYSARKIKQVKKGCMRGLVTMLQTRRPHASLPFWLNRDSKGYAVWSEDDPKVQAVRRLLQLYRDEAVNREYSWHSYRRIATILNVERWPAPNDKNKTQRSAEGNARHRGWTRNSVRNTLCNTLLYGVQVVFGREWPMCEGLITKEEFQALQSLRAGRAEGSIIGVAGVKHTYSRLLRCVCGHHMTATTTSNTSGKTIKYYCAAPPDKRRAMHAEQGYRLVHTSLDYAATHEFFDSLFENHPGILLNAYAARTVLNEEAQQAEALQAEIASIDAELQANMPEFEQAARQAVLLQRIKPTDVYRFQAEYKHGLDNLCLSYTERRNACQAKLRALLDEMERKAAKERKEPRTPEAWTAQWQAGEPWLRNRMLTGIIEGIFIEGEFGHERLVIRIKRNEACLPPIPLVVTAYRTGMYKRHLPPLAEWLQMVQSHG